MSYIVSGNIITPLGFSVKENFDHMIDGRSSVRRVNDPAFSPEPFWASLIDNEMLAAAWSEVCRSGDYTRFEKLAVLSMHKAVAEADLPVDSRNTGMILCTTKGNVDLLNGKGAALDPDRVFLWKSAERIAGFFGNPNRPIVISNACISGLLGIITAHRMVNHGLYDNVIVVGADVISPFVLSGFQSFKSLADGICKPFDKHRNGLNLGDGAATVVMRAGKKSERDIRVLGGAGTNDANHISGPSRTGDGLSRAIGSALSQARIHASEIDAISAHGTATLYNDEMEAKALALAGVQHAPVNSLKGYIGHTLGAAGLMETIMLLESMRSGSLPGTKGFETNGVSVGLNMSGSIIKGDFSIGLKTGSGFGGCNAAAVFSTD